MGRVGVEVEKKQNIRIKIRIKAFKIIHLLIKELTRIIIDF